MPCCVKCHSLDCIGCGACPEYGDRSAPFLGDDGNNTDAIEFEYINNEFDADPFGIISEDLIEEIHRRR